MIYQLEENNEIIGLYLAEDDIHDKIKTAYMKIQNLKNIVQLQKILKLKEYLQKKFMFKINKNNDNK